ncbi:MAG: paraquat-inducible protein A [Sulfurovum sp.]|nr:paraquat-inducible protein A [Sulfurovum sp.]
MIGYIKKFLIISSSSIVLITLIYTSIQLIEANTQAKLYKADYAQLHSVQYGMFNSDIWTAKVIKIIDHKIETFDFNSKNRAEIKRYIEQILDTLILEADRVVREHNQGQRGFFDSIIGSTKQMITDSLIDIKKLRTRVPEFTNAVMLEVEKPKNQARAKKVIREKFKEFTQEKFTFTTDMAPFNALLQKYNSSDLQSCTLVLDTHIQKLATSMNTQMNTLLLLAFILVILVVLQGTLNSFTLLILSATSITLLISGVMLPMLDIEAKIDTLSFSILDKAVIFENQILFFQSKSISDLVQLLLDSGESKMILVGVLLVMFSVIFPSLKIISSYLYFYSKGILGNNPITRFFVLRSTKWSMADVMVVSIFMAYLGLDGVVSSELKSLEGTPDPVNIITTNQTHLEVGFFLFLGFVAMSFVLSFMLESRHKKETK